MVGMAGIGTPEKGQSVFNQNKTGHEFSSFMPGIFNQNQSKRLSPDQARAAISLIKMLLRVK